MAEEIDKNVNEQENPVAETNAPEAVTETENTAAAQPEAAVPASGPRVKNTLFDVEKALLAEQNNNGKFPDFNVGDTVRVFVKISEGGKERLQPYEGVVMGIRGGMVQKSFVVRRISYEVAVERVFPFHSPFIEKVELLRRGRVRRAQLTYLRGRFGKKARIREKVTARS